MARSKAIRRGFRTVWWMAVRRRGARPLRSRRSYMASGLRELLCGLLTAGEHSWGPLRYEYEGARWRKRKCRWCGATLLPAEEMERVPFTEAEQRHWHKHMVKPTDADVERAERVAREQGWLRGDKWLWD